MTTSRDHVHWAAPLSAVQEDDLPPSHVWRTVADSFERLDLDQEESSDPELWAIRQCEGTP
jgi:hypothetical protein